MESRRILVVDDDPQILKMFTRTLLAAGYAVDAARSGTEAIRLIRETSVDLLVLDLSMPEPDGLEVLKLLAAVRPGLKVIAVTGMIPEALLRAARLAGAVATLSKPTPLRTLLETVEEVLSYEPRETEGAGLAKRRYLSALKNP